MPQLQHILYKLDLGVRIARLHRDFAGKSPLALDVKTDKEFIALQMRAIRQRLLEECEGPVTSSIDV